MTTAVALTVAAVVYVAVLVVAWSLCAAAGEDDEREGRK